MLPIPEKSRDDIQNLLTSSNIATLFLDRDLNIELFSPMTAGLLNIRPADIGRPITELSAKVMLPIPAMLRTATGLATV